MKKISAVLLIAVLAGGLVFAGFSGEASVTGSYNLDSKDYGFANGTNVKFDLDFVKELGSAKGEGAIFAEINATLALKLYDGEKGLDAADPIDAKIIPIAKIDSAKIYGENWSVDITGVPGVADFAESPIDTSTVKYEDDDYGFDKADYTSKETWKIGYQKAPGLAVTLYGYTLGVGGKHVAESNIETDVKKVYAGTDISAYLGTPDISLADGMTLKAAATFYQNHTNNITDPKKAKKGEAVPDDYDTKRGRAVGGSLKFAYESDSIKASIAADLGYTLQKYTVDQTAQVSTLDTSFKGKFDMDTLASFAMDPVAVDVYFNTAKAAAATVLKPENKMLLSAQVVTDLNSFDIPVKLTVTGKDLLQNMDLGLKAEVTAMEGLTITVKGGYVINSAARDIITVPTDFNVGKWSAGLDGKYEMDIMTVEAGFGIGNSGAKNALETKDATSQTQYNDIALTAEEKAKSLIVSAKASVATTSLIPGAELKLGWSGNDLTKVYKIVADKNKDENNNLGKVELSCKIAF